MTGAIDTFTTAEAKHGFLKQAQEWVDHRLGS
jgi:hypothetical protein